MIDKSCKTGHIQSGFNVMHNMKSQHSNLPDWVDGLQRQTCYSFTREQAMDQLNLSPGALGRAFRRLHAAGRIRRIQNEFYTIVPLEHAAAGNIPTDWFIAELMRFMDLPYYVGVLTAAACHGAAHQQPQEFQVVTPVTKAVIHAGKTRIRFLRYAGLQDVKTQPMKSFTGNFPVSTPECTALDLVRFQKQIGGLDAVMTVLADLAEAMTPQALLRAAGHENAVANVQRLGWLLDRARRRTLDAALAAWISKRNPAIVPLNGSIRSRKGSVDSKWRLILNDHPAGES